MRLHLLDGTYELFRSFHGRPRRQAPDGREVGATLGVIESVLALLRQEEVTHVAVATDHVIESFRNDLFPGYKDSGGVEPELLAQFPLVEEALESIGVAVWPMVEVEADDAIATAARRWSEEVDQVVILSPDKDLTQVVQGRRVVCVDRRREQTTDEEGVVQRFGVRPSAIPDYLALVGDSADRVPGLPGWGARSAGLVLARYPRLESVPHDSSDWEVEVRGAPALATTLRERWEDALLYRTLTTLRTDVPLPHRLEDLEWQGVPEAEFLALCEELGFDSVRRRPHRWA